ncbi:hypothetical protein NQZ68_018353 [Dissostichus eleginoides]|nr:hypothetical protein NQZ68_018353 [Dissostichus eleginoides]
MVSASSCLNREAGYRVFGQADSGWLWATTLIHWLKTYLISGRKVELDAQCVCPQVGLSGGEMGGVGLSSCPQPGTPDLIPGGLQAAEPPLRHQPLDRIRPPCVSRSVALSPGAEQGEDVAVLNGCQEEHKSSSAKFTPGQSPRAATVS